MAKERFQTEMSHDEHGRLIREEPRRKNYGSLAYPGCGEYNQRTQKNSCNKNELERR